MLVLSCTRMSFWSCPPCSRPSAGNHSGTSHLVPSVACDADTLHNMMLVCTSHTYSHTYQRQAAVILSVQGLVVQSLECPRHVAAACDVGSSRLQPTCMHLASARHTVFPQHTPFQARSRRYAAPDCSLLRSAGRTEMHWSRAGQHLLSSCCIGVIPYPNDHRRGSKLQSRCCSQVVGPLWRTICVIMSVLSVLQYEHHGVC